MILYINGIKIDASAPEALELLQNYNSISAKITPQKKCSHTEWTKEETLFLKDNLDMRFKRLKSHLSAHTPSAIATRRWVIKKLLNNERVEAGQDLIKWIKE